MNFIRKIKVGFTIYMFFVLINCSICLGQGIQIGMKCPDVDLWINEGVLVKKKKLSSLYGKPIILDFWFTSCKACIDFLPTLDSIQKAFKESIQVVLITYENQKKVNDLFGRIKRIQDISLISVVNDSVLQHLFPHKSYPHEVWIDKNGFVQYITSHKELTKENIKLFIEGAKLRLPSKDDNSSFVRYQSVFVNENFNDNSNQIIHFSYLGGEQKGISGAMGSPKMLKDPGITWIQLANQHLVNLYKYAFNRIDGFHQSRVIFISDSLRKLELEKKYCFELIIKDTSIEKALFAMKSELDRLLEIRSEISVERVNCLVLKRTSKNDKISSKVLGKADVYYKEGKLIFENMLMSALVNNFLGSKMPMIVIDETKYKGRVDIQLPEDLTDLNLVNSALAQYDLLLEIQVREMEVIKLER